MREFLERVSDTFAATNAFSRTPADLEKVKKVFVEHLVAYPPQDVIAALREWTAENANFPTVADLKKLAGAIASRRAAPVYSLTGTGRNADGKTDVRTFDERLQWAARIHRMLTDGAADGYTKAPQGERAEWVGGWMLNSIRNDLSLGRITPERARQLRAELEARMADKGVTADEAAAGAAARSPFFA